jgi:hypothetical protein
VQREKTKKRARSIGKFTCFVKKIKILSEKLLVFSGKACLAK